MPKSDEPVTGVRDIVEVLHSFDRTVRDDIPVLLRRYRAARDSGGVCYVDQPGMRRRVRPWCDALEIALAFDLLPEDMSAAATIEALRALQDPATGIVPEHIPDDRRYDPPHAVQQHEERYVTMIVNYALEGLGSHLPWPIANAEAIGGRRGLHKTLGVLDWANGAWGAGHWIDCYASCLYINRRYFGLGKHIEDLFGWLDTSADPQTGLWGTWRAADRWLQPVNCFYRLTRGTYAQFGRALPHPERAIDTILLHAADPVFFGEGRGTACNVLDVVHPLWLCLQQTSHRREEAQQWILERLPATIARWHPGAGMAFDPHAGDYNALPSLQGTEMWLSIIYLMATVAGLEDHLSYRPVGVHRLPAALPLSRQSRGPGAGPLVRWARRIAGV